MDFKAIVKSNLPEGVELSDTQLNAIAKALQSEQGKEFVPREDYRRKVDRIDELETALKDSGSSAADAEAYKKKVGELKDEIKRLTDSHEAEKSMNTKRQVLHRHLQADGANPKLVDLLEAKFDLDSLELDGDLIKDWATHAKSVKERYAEVFGTVQTHGVSVATPPAGVGGSAMPTGTPRQLNKHRIADI